jgi:ABC-type bacteriocin/lantibiotic exporter with double-glycine peptidase domain
MKLKVPLLKQKYKTGCGLAAMSMVYKYFGREVSEEEISKEIGGLTKWGSFMAEHALMARKLGFKVTCHSYNLGYFDPSDVRSSRKDLIRKIKASIKKEKMIYKKRMLNSLLKVLESDIKFEMRIPSLNIIKRFLDQKLPVVITVKSAVFFERKKDLKSGHYIVLTGYDNDKFYCNDPKSGKSKTISADKLIFALSNNVFDSSAYLLVIEPSNY